VVRDTCLGVYEYEVVTRYLDLQTERRNTNKKYRWESVAWHWHPVKSYSDFRWHGSNHVSREIYNKPIPMAVMVTMARIEALFPETRFYVSDLQDMKDPFLAVSVEGSDTFFVIERWDEPGFRSHPSPGEGGMHGQ
jgi:hypothetical protein